MKTFIRLRASLSDVMMCTQCYTQIRMTADDSLHQSKIKKARHVSSLFYHFGILLFMYFSIHLCIVKVPCCSITRSINTPLSIQLLFSITSAFISYSMVVRFFYQSSEDIYAFRELDHAISIYDPLSWIHVKGKVIFGYRLSLICIQNNDYSSVSKWWYNLWWYNRYQTIHGYWLISMIRKYF